MIEREAPQSTSRFVDYVAAIGHTRLTRTTRISSHGHTTLGYASAHLLLFAIGATFLVNSPRATAGITGGELLKACENTHILAYHKECYHYIEGFYYGQHFAIQMANAPPPTLRT